MAFTTDDRSAFRAQLMHRVPGWYSPWAHLGFPALVGLGLIAACIAVLHDVRPIEWLTVPGVLLLSNIVEWRTHRDALHRRTPGMTVLYDRHTPEHHRVFVTEDMEIRSWNEFRLVLIPAYGILAVLALDAPFSALLWHFGLRNVAALFVATSVAYILSYEWLHLSYHLPEKSAIGRLRLIRVLRRHHATHHAPELMQRWNFNVTVPLWDWVRGTIYRGELPAARRRAGEQR